MRTAVSIHNVIHMISSCLLLLSELLVFTVFGLVRTLDHIVRVGAEDIQLTSCPQSWWPHSRGSRRACESRKCACHAFRQTRDRRWSPRCLHSSRCTGT